MKRLPLLGIFLLSACGYALVGHSNFLDPSIRTIEVPAFVNRTTRVELEQRVTQAVGEELVSRGRLQLVNDPKQAHVVLRGSIDSFNIFPIAFEQGRATQYQISITAKIEPRDQRHASDLHARPHAGRPPLLYANQPPTARSNSRHTIT